VEPLGRRWPHGYDWIKCPATGKQASTGIETDPGSFAQIPSQIEGMHCLACGMKHKWLKNDAWLSETEDGLSALRDPDSDLKKLGIDTHGLLPAQMD
jgi:hypothetical protein